MNVAFGLKAHSGWAALVVLGAEGRERGATSLFGTTETVVAQSRATMIPVGYMAKRVSVRPEWIKAEGVADIYSVSGCVSEAFADYIRYWKHNGYWLFDSREVIRQLAQENCIDTDWHEAVFLRSP